MVCPQCGSQNVVCNTSTYTKSKSRGCLWNAFMICITGGIWLIWMLVRKKKEKYATQTNATCQNCGYTWIVSSTESKK